MIIFHMYSDPTPTSSKKNELPRWPSYTFGKGEFLSVGNSETIKIFNDFESTFTIAKDKGFNNAVLISSQLSSLLLILATLFLVS